jgi:hypothetical protein
MYDADIYLVRCARALLLLLALSAVAGCDSAGEPDWEAHSTELISFELPDTWETVPDWNGHAFSPDEDSYEKIQIQIRASDNYRNSARKIRDSWVGMREISEREGKLMSSDYSTQNGFERFDLVNRAPAPSVELIPLEYQLAGDQIYHKVMMINEQKLSITASLLAEEADYEACLPIFQRMLESIRPSGH